MIHVIGADPAPTPDPENLSLQHFSLRGEDLAGLPATLRREGVPWRASQMPSGPADIVLVNLDDPDGNAFHPEFPRAQVDVVDLAP